jgi:hypothetical protein
MPGGWFNTIEIGSATTCLVGTRAGGVRWVGLAPLERAAFSRRMQIAAVPRRRGERTERRNAEVPRLAISAQGLPRRGGWDLCGQLDRLCTHLRRHAVGLDVAPVGQAASGRSRIVETGRVCVPLGGRESRLTTLADRAGARSRHVVRAKATAISSLVQRRANGKNNPGLDRS